MRCSPLPKSGANIRLAAVAAAAVMALALAALTPAANAQTLSQGCARLHSEFDGGPYAGVEGAGILHIAAGEKLTISAGPPFNGTPTEVRLDVYDHVFNDSGGVVLDHDTRTTTGFPGTLTHIFMTEGDYIANWHVLPGANATWTVDCGPADPVEFIGLLREQVNGLALPHGLTTALNSKLDDALAALEAEGPGAADGPLQDFVRLVDAQTGKKIAASDADTLTAGAQTARNLLGNG